jgi:predicted RNase H-like nuclease (RuvC/YqgF family)
MFFRSIKDKIEISDLKVKLEDANANVDRLKAQLLRLQTNEDTAKATASIDFNKIKCFSIERNESQYRPCTILGYNLLTDAENIGPREWTLYCSVEQHERLIEEFNKQKKGK